MWGESMASLWLREKDPAPEIEWVEGLGGKKWQSKHAQNCLKGSERKILIIHKII